MHVELECTFNDYVYWRFRLKRARFYQLLWAVKVVEDLRTRIPHLPLPTAESQVRTLVPIRDGEGP